MKCTLVLPDFTGLTLEACTSGAIVMTHSGMADENGHELMLAHTSVVRSMAYRMRAIVALHAPDYDGFIPVCQHCRTAYPCLTMRVGIEDE